MLLLTVLWRRAARAVRGWSLDDRWLKFLAYCTSETKMSMILMFGQSAPGTTTRRGVTREEPLVRSTLDEFNDHVAGVCWTP